MTKLVVLYKEPKDPAHFDKHYREVHVPLAAELAGIRSYSFGPAKGPDGGAGAFHWMFSGTFDSPQAIADALGAPHGKKTLDDVGNFYHEAPTVLIVDNTDG